MPIARSSVSNIYAPAALPSSFSTTFPSTLNPFSAAPFTVKQGKTHGVLWNDVQSFGGSPGSAQGTAFNDVNDDDNIMCFAGAFTPNKHYVRIKVHLAGGYAPGVTHEIGPHVGCTITPNNIQSIELNLGLGVNVQPVRWNGALNDINVSAYSLTSGSFFVAGNGDDIIVGLDGTGVNSVVSLWQNVVGANAAAIMLLTPTAVFTDSSAGRIRSGSPGYSTFARTGATYANYDINSLEVGSA